MFAQTLSCTVGKAKVMASVGRLPPDSPSGDNKVRKWRCLRSLELRFFHMGVVLDANDSTCGARHIDHLGRALPVRSILVVGGTKDVDLFAHLEIQPLGRKRRPGVDGPAESGSGRSFNHRLNADLSQAVSVRDQSRVLSGDIPRADYLVDAWQHSGDPPLQCVVGRTATHRDHSIATEGGLSEDALEGDTDPSSSSWSSMRWMTSHSKAPLLSMYLARWSLPRGHSLIPFRARYCVVLSERTMPPSQSVMSSLMGP